MATTRNATTHWEGTLTEGAGQVDARVVGSRHLRRDVGVSGRGAERQDQPRGADRRRPLVVLLDGAVERAGQGGTPPTTLDDSADVTFQPGEGITGIHLTVAGTVPGIDGTTSSPPPRPPRSAAR